MYLRSFELQLSPLPTDSAAFQAGIVDLGKLFVLLHANSRELNDALSAGRLASQVSQVTSKPLMYWL